MRASEEERTKFHGTVDLFRKYGGKYDLDYLLMMAQGYQESQLNQDAQSGVGAIGVMQLMPETGQAMDVGDIHGDRGQHPCRREVHPLHEDRYYAEAADDHARTRRCSRSRPITPGRRVQELRRRPTERGLDPNVWFNNVEIVTAEKIGRETVQYVSNIYKYYIAYTLLSEDEAATQKTLEELEKRAP